MATKPTKLPEWATAVDSTVEPPSGRKTSGWVVSTRPPARWFNWLLNNIYQWCAYLKDGVFDGDITINSLDPSCAVMTDVDRKLVSAGGPPATVELLQSVISLMCLATWTERGVYNEAYSEPVGGNTPLFDAAFGNGRWVAVGRHEEGLTYTPAMRYSIDYGASWETLHPSGDNGLNGIAYGNGVWVAVGDNDGTDALILRSTNGTSWGSSVSNPATSLKKIAYGNGVWVAVGLVDFIRSIDDGVTWSAITPPVSDNFYGVAYANGVWIAVGNSYIIRSADDGATWTEVKNVSAGFRGVAYGVSNTWIAVGGARYKSTDNGLTWTVILASSDDSGIAYGNGAWVTGCKTVIGLGDGRRQEYSLDAGATWISIPQPRLLTLNSFAYGNGVFLGVGETYGTGSGWRQDACIIASMRNPLA